MVILRPILGSEWDTCENLMTLKARSSVNKNSDANFDLNSKSSSNTHTSLVSDLGGNYNWN